MNNPYLSIVVAVRNDNYGGDFIQRLQNSISWNTKWLEHFALDSEIILVNWNPIQENSALIDQMHWPQNLKHVTLRLITVPNTIHSSYVNPDLRDTVPLFEFIAKNAGIRRAKGTLVLSTNADILIHPEICRKVAQQDLQTSCFYRANRLDFAKTDSTTVNDMLDAGFAISLKGFMYQFHQAINKKVQYNLLKPANAIRLKWELFKFKFPELFSRLGITVVFNNGGYLCHCLNSGDFLLMTKKNWHNLKAYPEYTQSALHTDALFNILAFDKMEERVFTQPIFHQEHTRRYGWDAIRNDPKYQKAYQYFESVADDVKNNLPTDKYLNDENWGLVKFKLEEQIISDHES